MSRSVLQSIRLPSLLMMRPSPGKAQRTTGHQRPPLAEASPPIPVSRIEAHFFENQKTQSITNEVKTKSPNKSSITLVLLRFFFASFFLHDQHRFASPCMHASSILTTFSGLFASRSRFKTKTPPHTLYDCDLDRDSPSAELGPKLLRSIGIPQRRNSGPPSNHLETRTQITYTQQTRWQKDRNITSFHRRILETKHI
jgi:hypothetical protein